MENTPIPTAAPATAAALPFRTVTPHLVCAGAAAALDFYARAFGAVEHMRVQGEGGRLLHARCQIGDTVIMLADEYPEWGSLGPKARGGSSVTLHLHVADADAAFARAVAAGATVLMPLENMFWGDRYGIVEDPFGHSWSIAHRVRELSPQEMQAAVPAGMGGE